MATRDGNSLWQLVLDLGINIGAPAAVLLRLSGDDFLGPTVALIVALAFPLGFGIYGFWRERRYNFFSIIGFASTLLTGGIGLWQLDPQLLAIKEAAVPLTIAVAIVASRFTNSSLVATLLGAAIDFDTVRAALAQRGRLEVFEQRMARATYLIAGSFVLSAVLNYVLARLLVTSGPGTIAFNEELARLTVLSYPIIAVPSLLVLWAAVVWLVFGVQSWSGLPWKKIFR